MDKRVKWALLISSGATIVLLLIAALKENIFPEWREHRLTYAQILKEKVTDERTQALADSFSIAIDQNVIPALNRTDRCTTCHAGLGDPRMLNEEQPYRTHPGKILEIHPPGEFGCTICHEGQGLATETEDAHGADEHWPLPMLNNPYMYSTCAKCHDEQMLFGRVSLASQLDVPEGGQAAVLALGKRLVDQIGCRGCHILHGQGGTTGPDISFVGDKTRHDFDFSAFAPHEPREVPLWLRTHFREPEKISPGTVMPDLRLSAEDADALTAYAMSLRKRLTSAFYRPQLALDTPKPPPPTGEDLYNLMCSACHGTDGRESDVPGIRTPALNNVDSLAVASDDYYRHIIDKGRSDTAMPPWGPESENLTYKQIDKIVAHIRSWENDGPDLADISSKIGDVEMGRAYFAGLCRNCHGVMGKGDLGNALNSPTFLAIASDRFLAQTIVEGRPGTAMASWKHLNSQAVSDILAYIRSWQATAPTFEEVLEAKARYSDEDNVRVGAILYQGNCSGCHGTEGEGSIGPRLNSIDIVPIMDDEYLYRTITEGRPTTAMPTWRHLKAEQVAAIIAFLRSWNDAPPPTLAEAPPRGDYAVGEVHYNLACAQCHGVQGSGGVGPQLANPAFLSAASDDQLYHWIAYGRNQTAMMGFLPEAQGVVKLTREKIADVIAYIRHEASQNRQPVQRSGIGNAVLGRQIFDGNCAGCHGVNGVGASGPQLNNPTFLRSASDGFLAATIVMGRQGTAMRSMIHGQQGVGQIAPEQVQDVIGYMRLWDFDNRRRQARTITEMSERAIRSGKESFGRFCAGCHGPNGLGVTDGPDHFAPALNNREFLEAASDGFLLATIARGRSNTPMRPFGRGAGGIADLDGGAISDIVSYIRTWQDQYSSKGD